MGIISGTSNDVAKACTYDHPECKGYEYSVSGGYGSLCTPDSYEIKGGTSDDFQICIKKEGSV